MFLYASRPGAFPYPPAVRTLLEGWIFIALGMVVYSGTALAILSTARWYTTRVLGLALAAGIVSWALVQSSIAGAVFIIFVGLLILLPQIVYLILNREF